MDALLTLSTLNPEMKHPFPLFTLHYIAKLDGWTVTLIATLTYCVWQSLLLPHFLPFMPLLKTCAHTLMLTYRLVHLRSYFRGQPPAPSSHYSLLTNSAMLVAPIVERCMQPRRSYVRAQHCRM